MQDHRQRIMPVPKNQMWTMVVNVWSMANVVAHFKPVVMATVSTVVLVEHASEAVFAKTASVIRKSAETIAIVPKVKFVVNRLV